MIPLDPAQLFELCVFVGLLPIIAKGWAQLLHEILTHGGVKAIVRDWRTGA